MIEVVGAKGAKFGEAPSEYHGKWHGCSTWQILLQWFHQAMKQTRGQITCFFILDVRTCLQDVTTHPV